MLAGLAFQLWVSRRKIAEKADEMHRENLRKNDQMHRETREQLQEMGGRFETVWGWFERNIINGHGRH